MSTKKIVWSVVGFLFLVALFGLWGKTNSLIEQDEKVNQTYAQVQNVLQRQAELIPNLVETVRSYAEYEKETFKSVTEARAKAGGVINVDVSKIANDPVAQQKFMQVQAEMQSSISRLLLTMEKYPELKANQLYQNLQTELAGSINRVTVERRNNQLAVENYNRSIRTVPFGKLVATLGGYEKRPYFTAAADAQTQPKIKM